jgi:acetyl coenzyme A synthetase (ADP forming)-like protein
MAHADLREYAEPVVLKDGGSLLIRAVRPSDEPLLADLLRRLGPESARYRAFGAAIPLTAEHLASLTHADFEREVALGAVLRERGVERMVGAGTYSRVGHARDAKTAEIALTVADEHQGRGIGTLLLEHLARIAQASGIEELRAEVMAGNRKMMDVFAACGLEARESMEDGVYRVTFPTRATEAFLCTSLARERRAAAESVRVFFEPASVAVIGASRSERSIGRAILGNICRGGFSGPIFPINPNAREIDGLPCFSSVGETPSRVDLAIVAVPAPMVEQVIADCARAGVRGVVVISSGFAETGPEGKRAQDRLRELVRSSGMRMVGPNSMGVSNRTSSVSLDATFAPVWPPAGNVSMLTQSGALGIAMLDHAARLNLGICGFVSVGNKADVSGNDLIAYWAEDPDTKVIALYLESVGNPRKFARLTLEVAMKKPIVAVKSGRSAAGTRAAASHSAALASLDIGVDALFAQAGVIRTATLEELFDVVTLLSTQPLPAGDRVGVVTNAGGPGILLADACEAQGLKLPELTKETLDRLRTFLPPQAGLANPIDMIASATPEDYARTIEAVAHDPNVDALVVIYIPPLVTNPEEVAAAIASAAGRAPATKPIATVFMSSKGAPEILSRGPRGPIPSYSFPENVALAIAAAARYRRWRERPKGTVLRLQREQERAIRQVIGRIAGAATCPFWVEPQDLARLLELAGIPLAPTKQTGPAPDEVAVAAAEIGGTVVVKARARGLVHKSDVGGVVLGLESPAAARSAAEEIAARVGAAGWALEGFVVQRQIDGGVEALVGITSDPSLGPLLVAGIGGVQVELIRDVAIRLTPVSDVDAREMIDGLRAGKLLSGFRGASPADRDALLDVIQRVSALVEVVPELLELELNPVKVLPAGRGAVAVDARMRLSPA